MKVGGKALVGHAKEEISLYRGREKFTVTITALPVGWHDITTTKKLIPPKAPEEFVKDASGRHVKLANKTLQTRTNFDDPKYKEESNLWQARYHALAICDLLREDETVTWGSDENVIEPPNEKTGTPAEWEAFADKILVELASAGFTDTDITEIMALAGEISSSTDVEGALKRFLSSRDTQEDPSNEAS